MFRKKEEIVRITEKNGEFDVYVQGNTIKIIYGLISALSDAVYDTMKDGVTMEEAADTCKEVLLGMMRDREEQAHGH